MDRAKWEKWFAEYLEKWFEEYGYGEKGDNSPGINYYILSTEELDNDELISLLEDNPTYDRKADVFKEYKGKAKPVHRVHPASAKGNSGPAITF